MKIKFLLLASLLFTVQAKAQQLRESIVINEALEIIKLSGHVYVHVSLTESEKWGKFTSNGLIFVNNGKAILVDTPMEKDLIKDLVHWIENDLDAKIVAFVPNHWHQDCMAGFEYLDSLGTPSYAHKLTIEILQAQNLPAPRNSFTDSLSLPLDDLEIVFRYFGAGHTPDNTVAWIPSEKILFGGCMVKALDARGKGNIADASLEEWPKTLAKVLKAYENAGMVIPGHGKTGGTDLLRHSIGLLKKEN